MVIEHKTVILKDLTLGLSHSLASSFSKKDNISNQLHIPVMVTEMLNYLAPKDNQLYLDCTFGAGGYSKQILESCNCKVIAFDQDPIVIDVANKFHQKFQDRFVFHCRNFVEAYKILSDSVKVDGIVIDLGVSSMQLDEAKRGFSFRYNASLDMRMSQQGYKAEEFINTASEQDLADVIYHFGEERNARKIAKHIINSRFKKPITTTFELAEIVRNAVGSRRMRKIDSATRTFQAIRIFINNELQVLESFLQQSLNLLNANGRLVVVSFHSLEDSIVKDFMRRNKIKKVAKSKYNFSVAQPQTGIFNLLTKKVVTPTRDEIIKNPRSRSAKLRAVQVNNKDYVRYC